MFTKHGGAIIVRRSTQAYIILCLIMIMISLDKQDFFLKMALNEKFLNIFARTEKIFLERKKADEAFSGGSTQWKANQGFNVQIVILKMVSIHVQIVMLPLKMAMNAK